MKKRIPFDSLCLAASLIELRTFVGGFVRRVIPLSETEIAIHLAAQGSEGWLLLSADATFARLHLIGSRPAKGIAANDFIRVVRSRLEGSRLNSANQLGSDRIARLEFTTRDGPYTLHAEIMGKHSNLILVDPSGRIAACLKSVGISKSRRPVLVGRKYELPPIEVRLGKAAADFVSASPFLSNLATADPAVASAVERVLGGELAPVAVHGFGAYPISVASAGYAEVRAPSFYWAIEREISWLETSARLEQRRRTLAGHLERVLVAREAALHDLYQAADTAARARDLQIMGELVLAYGSEIAPGSASLETVDYEGRAIVIALRTDLGASENAQRYFDKAKRAKAGAAGVQSRIEALSADALELGKVLKEVEGASSLDHLRELSSLAASKRWLNKPVESQRRGEEAKPAFEGHRIRSIDGPRGFRILYGENASSNDYLTNRVAKPNDYWLHVRGATSAHVVIQTMNQPARVGPDVLRFAAEVAYKNSSAKHSQHVAVDYTLKKYVRKPRGSAVGTAVYTHEKTIYVGE